MTKVTVWCCIQDGADGSAYPMWFLTKDIAKEFELYQHKEYGGGFAEPCISAVETFEGSNIHKQAVGNEDRKEW